jgi:hypothetical protein
MLPLYGQISHLLLFIKQVIGQLLIQEQGSFLHGILAVTDMPW